MLLKPRLFQALVESIFWTTPWVVQCQRLLPEAQQADEKSLQHQHLRQQSAIETTQHIETTSELYSQNSHMAKPCKYHLPIFTELTWQLHT